jgi:predicted P-loop ATPase
MCQRVIHPGVKFDYCLVLEGAQGRGKSTVLRILGGEWFSDIELDLSNKDSMSNIRGKWLHEFGEMGSIARAEASRQKSFLSRQVDEFRPSYGRREIRCPRQLAFAGTTNEWQWNKDATGGRRFWPVAVGDQINTAGVAAIRDQLFAEAMHCALAGERYWPDAEEQRTLFDDEQLAREAPEAFCELLAAWLADERQDIGDTFTLADAVVKGLHIEARAITRDIQTRVGIALAKLNCERVEKRTGPSRFVYRRPTRKVASSQPEGSDAQAVEVPF